MYTRALDASDPEAAEREWSGTDAYARTKRMQVALARMWADRMRTDHVAVHAMHPGWADDPRHHRVAAALRPAHRPDPAYAPRRAPTPIVWLAAAAPASVTAGAAARSGATATRARRRSCPAQEEPPGERARLWEAVTDAVGVDAALTVADAT